MGRHCVAKAAVLGSDGRFDGLNGGINDIVEDKLSSTACAWDSHHDVLLSAIFRVVEKRHMGAWLRSLCL